MIVLCSLDQYAKFYIEKTKILFLVDSFVCFLLCYIIVDWEKLVMNFKKFIVQILKKHQCAHLTFRKKLHYLGKILHYREFNVKGLPSQILLNRYFQIAIIFYKLTLILWWLLCHLIRWCNWFAKTHGCYFVSL